MESKKKVSLKEVAQAAGVSSAMVSMVLNGKAKQYGISEEAARKVKAVAKEMNYRPNIMARGLRSGHSHLIGLLVADIHNPFFSYLAREVERTANICGYTVVYGNSDEESKHLKMTFESLINQGVEGLIVVPCENTEKFMSGWVESNFPLVLVDRDFPSLPVSSVTLDNFHASFEMTELMIKEGYRNIAFIAYDTEMSHMNERRQGYEQAMTEAGLTPEVYYLSPHTSREDMERLFQVWSKQKRHAEAMIFSTNTLTITALYEVKRLGLRIPDDLAVFGFDGGSVFDLYTPSISYVRQPVADMGREAVQLLVSQIENGAEPQKKKLQAQVFPNESSQKRD